MGIAPMYLTEIAPVHYRGVFGTLGQFGVVTSMLLSQVIISVAVTAKFVNVYKVVA